MKYINFLKHCVIFFGDRKDQSKFWTSIWRRWNSKIEIEHNIVNSSEKNFVWLIRFYRKSYRTFFRASTLKNTKEPTYKLYCNTIKSFLSETEEEVYVRMFPSHRQIVLLFIILLTLTALPFNDGFSESDQLGEWSSETSPRTPRFKRKYKECGYLRWKCTKTYVNLKFIINFNRWSLFVINVPESRIRVVSSVRVCRRGRGACRATINDY